MSARSRPADDGSQTRPAEGKVSAGGEQAARIGQRAAENIEPLQRVGVAVAREGATVGRRLTEEAAEAGGRVSHQALTGAFSIAGDTAHFGRLWFSWWPEQMQDNWRATMALARCQNFGEVAHVQAEFLRSSMERFARCMNSSAGSASDR